MTLKEYDALCKKRNRLRKRYETIAKMKDGARKRAAYERYSAESWALMRKGGLRMRQWVREALAYTEQ